MRSDLKFYGGDRERIGALTDFVQHGDEFKVWESLRMELRYACLLKIGNMNVLCLATPCHTSTHICYFVTDSKGDKAVFTGDTLFLGGCGRFFEGTAEQMHEALCVKLATLPNETVCGRR